jgi:hypothetical protein
MSDQISVEQAKAVASSGDKRRAIAILREVLKQDPGNVAAWLALADIVENPDQSKQCLERVLKIDPNNLIAQQKLYGQQPSELDFLFESADEPEIETGSASEDALDFSGMAFNSQPVQSAPEEAQPQETIEPQPSTPPPISSARPQQKPQQQRPPRKKPAKKKKKGLSVIEITLIGVIAVMCLCVGVMAISSLGNSSFLEPEPTSPPEEITAVIFENIRASNAKDINGYMATIHSDSPGYNLTKSTIETAFSDQFTLFYKISDVYVIEQSANEAVVHFVLTTRLRSGSVNFRDNRVTGEMTLRKEDGAWRIYNQDVTNLEYLD